MRKAMPVLSALLPYIYFLGFGCMLLLDIDSDAVLLGFLAVYFVLGILVSALYAVFADARSNFAVKLAAIPGDLFVIAYFVIRCMETEQATQNGAIEGGLGIIVLIILSIPYLLCRVMTMISSAVACGRRVHGSDHIYTVLHVLPIFDIIGAAIVRKRIQNH
ncbi:MAG: hypothetical protein ACI4PO_05660 [Faecousia sp.]